jgi:hypothetical protein
MAKLQTTKPKGITPMNKQLKIFNLNTFRILFATCLSALCLIALSTQAATINVTNTNDSGAGSLRQAIADAHDGDTIDFGVAGTITLTTGELLVNKSVTINGPGLDHLTVDGNHATRVFHVSGGVTATIAGLTITNGQASGFSHSDGGGGIYNDQSTLTVSNCTLSGNSAHTGGGIYNDANLGSATLEVAVSTLSGNSAYDGGGILNDGHSGSATLQVLNSTLSGNSTTAYGGGIYNGGTFGSATLEVSNSTLSGNSAFGGGGIWNGAGSGTGNAALRVINSTLSDNSGIGIYNELSATLTIGGTILKNVPAPPGRIGTNIFNTYDGTVVSLGYNLSSDVGVINIGGTGDLTATGDQINTDPMLGPLQDNGGSTFTHELLSGSPAIDAGDPNFTPPADYDQRGTGFPRVFNGRVDIGAFEVQTVTPAYAGQVQPPINPDGSSTFNVRRGVVPVKFNLALGGVATCDLPPATISVTRTAGGVIGQVNESDYSGNADTGSNFRIDNCQYIYNLNSRALGVGTYRVDILINDQLVGSATFGLN